MEQRVLNTRSVKTIGVGGLETWTTVVIDSLHYESHLICTNCGPLGLKGESVEPSTNRAALSDRSWARIVHSDENHTSGDVDFDPQTASDDLKQQINRFRVCACLVAYVLIFIKHIPSCRPNLTYANALCNKWYEILWNEYNLPRPSKRKKIKLRMMFELFATESAVFETFMLPETAVDYADMQPDERGNLSPFCIEQLAHVIRSLQRCLDFETILTAWSHSLDHSPATSSHIFQMKTVLAQLHGSELDHLKLGGEVPPAAGPPAQAQMPPPHAQHEAQARGAEIDPSAQATFQAMGNVQQQQPQQQQLPQFAEERDSDEVSVTDSAIMAAADSAVRAHGEGSTSADAVLAMANRSRGNDAHPQPPPPPPPQQAQQARGRSDDGWTHSANGKVNNPASKILFKKLIDKDDGLTRQGCVDAATDLAMTRTLRCEMSNRALTQKIKTNAAGEHVQLTRLLTDGYDNDKEPMHLMASTGQVISAKRAAGACMPNPSDILSRGFRQEFLKGVIAGVPTTGFHDDYAKIGINPSGWEYEVLPGDATLRGPADFNFSWVRLSAFTKSSGGDDGQVALAGGKQKSLWANSAKTVQGAMKGKFSLMSAYSVPREFIRDLLFMIAWNPIENKIRIPKPNYVVDRGHVNTTTSMRADNHPIDASTKPTVIHPSGMFVAGGTDYLQEAFRDPHALPRPRCSMLGDSIMQNRLDALVDKRALPVCATPESFERGVPIKECEAFNGFYFNKHTASEQAALVMEMGLSLANVPGIAGGMYTTVPDTFKMVNTVTHRDAVELQREATVLQEKRAAVDARSAAGSSSPDVQMADAGSEGGAEAPLRRDSFGELELGSNQATLAEDRDEDFAEFEVRESPGEADEDQQTVDTPLQQHIEYPAAAGTPPRPGAAVAIEARASADPSATVPTLPYEWDQAAIFFSIKMAETLHNDVHAYVGKFRDKFGDVYDDEEPELTLATLPQLSLRFPGVTDGTTQDSEGKTKELMPLSVAVPLEQSRFCDVAKQIRSERASKPLTEAVHSFAHGRAIAYNDPEVLEQEAEARGVDGGILMKGNLFARSTWQRFTISALDSRGMRTPEEEARVNDQGLCMRLRVRNHRASANPPHPEANAFLKGNVTRARPMTFTAQERYKRMLGDATEEDERPEMASDNCKRRSLERAREEDLMKKSMEAEPSV